MKTFIRYVLPEDREYLAGQDHHISAPMLQKKMADKEYLLLVKEDKPIGWLRFGYFWDNLPMMNLLWLDEPFRRQGGGRKLVSFWEAEMKQAGYDAVMTSTLSNEPAQHFYRQLGYKDMGSLLLPEEPLEIIFWKVLA